MDSFSTKDIVGVILLGIVFLVVAFFVRAGSDSRRPREKSFNCWRCKALTPHTQRTIEAWRNGKTRLFCGACHAHWLQSHPPPASQPRPISGGYRPRRRSSPVGALVVFGVVVVMSVLGRSCS
jgi:hypothetical protein